MNITFVTATLGYGGATKMIMSVAQYMKKRGHQVSIIDLNLHNNFDRAPSDIEVLSASIAYTGSLSTNFNYIKFVYNSVKRFQPDVLVSFVFASNFYTSFIGKILRIPVIISERADPYTKFRNISIMTKLKLKVICMADGAVFQTDEASKFYPVKLRNRSVVIPNIISLTENIQPIDYKKRPKTIVTHGTFLLKQKRQDVLLEGYNIFHKEFPEYKLIIYGVGPDENKIVSLINDLGISDFVEMRGKTKSPLNDISKEGIYVTTSDYEGISNSLLEAMAVGLPVISTDHSPGGARFLIDDHNNGLLIPVQDANSLSNALKEYANNTELAESCGKEATKVLLRFSPNKILGLWESYICKIANID